MKHLVSLWHRPANAAGLREALFHAGALQGMVFQGLGMHTKPGGMDAKRYSQLAKRRGMLTKLDSVLTKPEGMNAKPGGRLTKPPGMHAKRRGMLTKLHSALTKPRSELTKLDFNPFPPRKLPFWACFRPSTPLW